MSGPLPKLRRDLVITPEGDPPASFLVTAPGLAKRRLPAGALSLLQLLDDHADMESWSRAALAAQPAVTSEKLGRLLDRSRAAGLLQDRGRGVVQAAVAPAEAPAPGPRGRRQLVAEVTRVINIAELLAEEERAKQVEQERQAAAAEDAERARAAHEAVAARADLDFEVQAELPRVEPRERAPVRRRAPSASERERNAYERIGVPSVVIVVVLTALWVGLSVEAPHTLRYPCVLRAGSSVTVRAPVSGMVDEIAVVAGQRVDAGDVVAHIEGDYDVRLLQLEAALAKAKAELSLLEQGASAEEIAQARARVSAVSGELAAASRRRGHVAARVREGVVPRADLDEASREVERLRGELLEARAALREVAAGSGDDALQQKAAEVERREEELRYLRQQDQDSTVRAPIAGVVGPLVAEDLLGTTVAIGSALFEIVDETVILADLRIAQRDLDLVAEALPVTVKATGLPEHAFAARVGEIGLLVEENDDGRAVVPAIATIPNEDLLLRRGMSGWAEIRVSEPRPLLFLFWDRFARWARAAFWLS